MELVFDIETARQYNFLQEAPEAFQDAWRYTAKKKYPDMEPEDSFVEWAGLHPEFGKVVCICAKSSIASDGGKVFRFTGQPAQDDLGKGAEFNLLKEFKDMLANGGWKGARLVGHAIKRFDVPYVVTRMAANWIQPPPELKMYGLKPWEVDMLDTMEIWKSGQYSTTNAASLTAMCLCLNVETPKGDIDGSQVSNVYWSEGLEGLKRITNYCERDVEATAECLNKLRKLKMC